MTAVSAGAHDALVALRDSLPTGSWLRHDVDPDDTATDHYAQDHPERQRPAADLEQDELASVEAAFYAAARAGKPWDLDEYKRRIDAAHAHWHPTPLRKEARHG